MNVASKDLCEELYKLSGWFQHHINPNTGEITNPREVIQPGTGGIPLPAYDLGYLLRKLPVGSYVATRKHGATASTGNGLQNQRPYTILTSRGETPEDAVCKLAIELFKSGILKHLI